VDGAAQTDGRRSMSAPEMARRSDFAGRRACNRAAADAQFVGGQFDRCEN